MDKYDLFIEECRNKDYGDLFLHKHHITPKSVARDLGWSKEEIEDPNNLISISVYDHFWAHVYYYESRGLCPTAPQRILKSLNATKYFTEDQFNEAELISRRLLSEARKGKVMSDESKAKISKANTGRRVSDETRHKISEHHKKNPYKHTEEELLKMSKSQINKSVSDETRQKLSNSLKGRVPWNKGLHCSDEQKEKLRKANTGYKFTEEQRSNLSKAKKGQIPWNKGKKTSEETKMKIRLSCLRSKHPELSEEDLVELFEEVK